MEFNFESWPIIRLINYIENEDINLRPHYQRNFIWNSKDQKSLIDSIKRGYPLPTFFIYRDPFGKMEMVDGQQRSTTLYRYYKNKISDSNGIYIQKEDKAVFEEYNINISIISKLLPNDSLEAFYALVNKSGKHVNTHELNKSTYYGTNFFQLVEDIVVSDELQSLDLFTEASIKRMNDRGFVEELISTIIYGTFDKRKAVETIFKNDITEEEKHKLYNATIKAFERINKLNNIFAINKTRYKQRNDFLTLFQFIHQNIDTDFESLKYQYSILRLLEQYIKPSQDSCEPLKEYALNCVSQSNSKIAREARLVFFNNVLKNTDKDSSIISEISEFLEDIFEIEEISSLIEINGYLLIDVGLFS